MDKNQLILILILLIYLIGIPITYAIMEDPKDKSPFETAPMIAVTWPISIIYYIFILLAYPFYWITKKNKK